MPEQLTKHPEVTLKVLRSAGAKCGEGEPQTILKACPADRFCQLPGGEVCVYGLGDADRMTQITASDWGTVRQALSGQGAPASPPAADGPGHQAWLLGGANLLIGLLIGAAVMRWRLR